MGGLGRKGSGGWRRRGSFFSVLVPRLSLLSASSALLAAGGGKRDSKFKRAPAPTSAAACLTALLMLSSILPPASAQVVSLSCNNAGYFGETNAVEYNGRVYRTLDGASPLDTSARCQNYYLGLLSGWALAADNADSQYVIRSYRWGTHVMVVANGYAYCTASQGSGAGSFWGYGVLRMYGSEYIVNSCNHLILISKTGSACTACPAGESEIAQRECGGRVCA
jgi:hypothetical protein